MKRNCQMMKNNHAHELQLIHEAKRVLVLQMAVWSQNETREAFLVFELGTFHET